MLNSGISAGRRMNWYRGVFLAKKLFRTHKATIGILQLHAGTLFEIKC